VQREKAFHIEKYLRHEMAESENKVPFAGVSVYGMIHEIHPPGYYALNEIRF
jgi:hypothetical protein